MNCAELKADIEELERKRDELSAKIAEANETGRGTKSLKLAQENTAAAEDELLGKYLKDFVEHNQLRELRYVGLLKGETGDEYDDGAYGLAVLPDGRVMLAGGGDSYDLVLNEEGDYQVGGIMGDVFVDDTNGRLGGGDMIIRLALSDGSLLLKRGEFPVDHLSRYEKHGDGEWYEREVVAALDELPAVAEVTPNTIVAMVPDGFNRYDKQSEGWIYSKLKAEELDLQHQEDIVDMCVLANGRILMATNRARFFEYSLQGDELKLENKLLVRGITGRVSAVTALPDGGILFTSILSQEGGYEEGTEIYELEDFSGGERDAGAPSILLEDGGAGIYERVDGLWVLPGNRLLASDEGGCIYQCEITEVKTVEDLRRNLDKIVGEA